MRLIPLLSLAAAGTLLLAGCFSRSPQLDVAGISEIRTYTFVTTVPDPEPAWNPVNYLIAARTLRGFATYQEGSGRQEYFESTEGRESCHLAWVNRDQFVFGPPVNALRTSDGRIVPAAEGLTVVDVVDNGFKCQVQRRPLAQAGYLPRPSGDEIYAQLLDKMIIVDRHGQTRDAGEGFFPVPQPDGPGICWQETPVIEPDHWTSKPVLGRLIIRWRPGVVTEVPGAVQARWLASGGVVCTVLNKEPVADRPWYAAGTKIVVVAGPQAAPVVIAEDCRDPDPHPSQPIVAATAADGGIRLLSTESGKPARTFTTVGSQPKWSFDGQRLLAVEPNPARPGTALIRVRVLRSDFR